MSVINQMLRDLDRQTALAGTSQRPSATRSGQLFGTQTGKVFVASHRAAWHRWLKIGAGALFVLGAGVVVGLEGGMLDISAPAGSVHAVALPEAVVVESPVAPVVMAVDALPVPDSAPLRDAVPMVALPIRGPVPKVVAMVKPVLSNNESRPAPVPELALGPVAPSSVLAVLAQAQSLWRSGSQEAALELLSQAVASAERDAAVLSSLAHNDRLVLLVRELVRQQLAMGQVGPAMEVMVRLAPALSGSAETWALRGHAAQRLGQHQSSADAYVMALKIRPNEPRWMLGAAVSLASLGQLQDAADMADKARTAGWVSPDVLAYLSQLGVTLRQP